MSNKFPGDADVSGLGHSLSPNSPHFENPLPGIAFLSSWCEGKGSCFELVGNHAHLIYVPAEPIWDLDSHLFPGLAGRGGSWEAVS